MFLRTRSIGPRTMPEQYDYLYDYKGGHDWIHDRPDGLPQACLHHIHALRSALIRQRSLVQVQLGPPAVTRGNTLHPALQILSSRRLGV